MLHLIELIFYADPKASPTIFVGAETDPESRSRPGSRSNSRLGRTGGSFPSSGSDWFFGWFLGLSLVASIR
ncbi:hypothetical protein RHMOL_Rhmol05G0265900 [Rhododendron molle]|uniref:Uncharacterized protein n=1 Tax=Rhododendron molle TaxID=49168 RepID=A0ACC0NVG7_RHOML|nr:hypothetical protein RHMOL_Rhmol05G0265900 [Rhododendron molle]